jgi:hypothetical protein
MNYEFKIYEQGEAAEDFGLTVCVFDDDSDVEQIVFSKLTDSNTYDEQRKQIENCNYTLAVEAIDIIEDWDEFTQQVSDSLSVSKEFKYTFVSDINYLT